MISIDSGIMGCGPTLGGMVLIEYGIVRNKSNVFIANLSKCQWITAFRQLWRRCAPGAIGALGRSEFQVQQSPLRLDRYER